MLGMKNEGVISISPCQPNIFYSVISFVSLNDTFKPLLDSLTSERSLSQDTVGDLMTVQTYTYTFEVNIGINFTESVGAPDLPQHHLVDTVKPESCAVI